MIKFNDNSDSVVVFNCCRIEGFGGFCVRLVRAIVFALENDCGFSINEEAQRIKWSRFFEPICPGCLLDGKKIIEKTFQEYIIRGELLNEFFLEHQELFKRIFVLNEKTKQKVQEEVNKIPYKEPFIALHLRGGDGGWGAGHQNVLDKSQDFLPQFKNIFVSTDSYDLCEKAKSLFPDHYVFSSVAPSYRGWTWGGLESHSEESVEAHVIRILTDIELMKRADLFIGRPYSHMSCLLSIFAQESKIIY